MRNVYTFGAKANCPISSLRTAIWVDFLFRHSRDSEFLSASDPVWGCSQWFVVTSALPNPLSVADLSLSLHGLQRRFGGSFFSQNPSTGSPAQWSSPVESAILSSDLLLLHVCFLLVCPDARPP